MRAVQFALYRLFWRLRTFRYLGKINNNGKTVIRIDGSFQGLIYIGEQYGVWTFAPSFLYIGYRGHMGTTGPVHFYGGNTIRVEPGARLVIGGGTLINLDTILNVKRSLTIGENCLLAQGAHIRDNDGHNIVDVEEIQPVTIGDHVWIGYSALVLKGVTIGSGAIVAAN
jgi:acetyltransferase-like isoleucine patch superfamily enzyme